jgi:hypothetical protein
MGVAVWQQTSMAQHEPAGRQFIGSITEDTRLSDEFRSDENEKRYPW